MAIEELLQQAWFYLLQVGSLGGLIAGLSLAYTILFNRLQLRIDLNRVRVDRDQSLIDVSVRVRNTSPRRDTSTESIRLAITYRPADTYARLWSPWILWMLEASSVREERAGKLEQVERNIKIRAGDTKDFEARFSRPRSGQFLPQRSEWGWRRYYPMKLVVETTHRTFTIPIRFGFGQQDDAVRNWFWELWV